MVVAEEGLIQLRKPTTTTTIMINKKQKSQRNSPTHKYAQANQLNTYQQQQPSRTQFSQRMANIRTII